MCPDHVRAGSGAGSSGVDGSQTAVGARGPEDAGRSTAASVWISGSGEVQHPRPFYAQQGVCGVKKNTHTYTHTRGPVYTKTPAHTLTHSDTVTLTQTGFEFCPNQLNSCDLICA